MRYQPLVAACLCLLSCRTVYQPEVRRGAVPVPSSPVVVLFPLACSSTDDKCEPSFSTAVTARVRSELEFAGYSVLDGEKLVADARARDQRDLTVTADKKPVLEASSTRKVGSIFEDLPPEQQRTLLAEAHATGVVTGSIQMLGKDKSKNWLVEVSVRHASDKGELIWVTRCKHESYWNERNGWSIEQAADCALKGALSPAPAARPGSP